MARTRIDPKKIRQAIFEDPVSFWLWVAPTAALVVKATLIASPLALLIVAATLGLMYLFYLCFPEVMARSFGELPPDVLTTALKAKPTQSYFSSSFAPATPPPRSLVLA